MTIFVKVVDAGSFAAAARHFGMSAAMVSKHVQTLEEHLSARLLNRTTRRLSARKLCTLAMVVCASPGYLEKYGTPREPRDLVFHNCLAYTYANPWSVWTFVDQNGEQNVIRISGR